MSLYSDTEDLAIPSQILNTTTIKVYSSQEIRFGSPDATGAHWQYANGIMLASISTWCTPVINTHRLVFQVCKFSSNYSSTVLHYSPITVRNCALNKLAFALGRHIEPGEKLYSDLPGRASDNPPVWNPSICTKK